MPAEAWGGTAVASIALPSDQVPTASPMEPVMEVIDRLRPESGGFAVVLDRGAIVGLFGPDDLRRALRDRAPSGRPSTGRGTRNHRPAMAHDARSASPAPDPTELRRSGGSPVPSGGDHPA